MRRGCEGQNRNVSCSLDGNGDLSLVFGAVSGNSPGNDLPPFRHKIPKDPWIPVIDIEFLIGAKPTNLSSQERFSLSIRRWFITRFPHSLLLSLLI